MAVVAGEITVAQGDAGEVVAVHEEYVVKEGEKAGQARVEKHERILVAVPDGQGNVAVAEGVRVQAVEIQQESESETSSRIIVYIRVPPAASAPPPTQRPPPQRATANWAQPRRTPTVRPTTDRTPLIQPRAGRRKKYQVHLSGCLLCSLLFVVCGIALIGVSFGLVWPCPPFKVAAVSTAVFGVITVLVGCTCCCFVFRIRGTKAILLCLLVGALFLLGLSAALFEISEALIKKRNLFSHHSHATNCSRYIQNAVVPSSLAVVTYVLLGLVFFYFIGTILNAFTGSRQRPVLYK